MAEPRWPNLGKALAAFQAEAPRVGKGNVANAGTYQYRYADLADINEAVLPLLGKHGLSFSSKPTLSDGRFVLAYTLRHASGEEDGGEYPLPDPTKTSAQQIGSAISYARRYTFCAITGIAPGGDDDDGAQAAPASVERVERTHYDETKPDQYEHEITVATNAAELTAIGNRLRADRRAGVLSPAAYDRLLKAGAARRGELNGAVLVEEAKPDTSEQESMS